MQTQFMERVEFLLHSKSTRESKALILRLAAKLPASGQKIFLEVLGDNRVVIEKSKKNMIEAREVINQMQRFLDGIEDYNIETCYNEGYSWNGGDSWYIKDDGFVDDFNNCYNAAESLLVQRQYTEAAMAFRLLYDAIVKFDAHYENYDYGASYVSTFIEEGLLDIKMEQIKALRGYSSLMAAPSDLIKELYDIYEIITARYTANITFGEVLKAGSESVPDKERILSGWLHVLGEQAAETATPYIKEAAILLDKPEVLENYAKNAGAHNPIVHIALCEMLTEMHAETEKIIDAAVFGLKHTPTEANEREQLAALLAETAKKSGNAEARHYAVMEKYFSNIDVKNYFDVLGLDCEEANQTALAVLPSINTSNFVHGVIRILNGGLHDVYGVIKNDENATGWSYSLKGQLFPFMVGALTGFDKKAIAVQQLIKEKCSADGLYELLTTRVGAINVKTAETIYNWCAGEVSARVDAIVSNQHRDAYNRAAWLLVAMCEVRVLQNTVAPLAPLYAYLEKYPRHRAFHNDIVSAAKEAGLSLHL